MTSRAVGFLLFEKFMPQVFSNTMIELLSWVYSKTYNWCWSVGTCKNTDVFLENELCCNVFPAVLPSAHPSIRQFEFIPVSVLSLVKGSWLHITPSSINMWCAYASVFCVSTWLCIDRRGSWLYFCQVICTSRIYILQNLERYWG